MKKRGKFIVLEGGERAGKGSAVKHLRRVLPGSRVLFVREPGGTALAESVREIFLTRDVSAVTELAMLFTARLDHAEKIIAPALKKGIHVVCERWNASTYAYQIVARKNARGLGLFRELEETVDGIAKPDLYVYLDVSAAMSEKRLRMEHAKRDRIERLSLAFHRSVRKGYDDYLSERRNIRIDAAIGLDPFCRIVEGVVRSETGL
jgi:dTMP kinase